MNLKGSDLLPSWKGPHLASFPRKKIARTIIAAGMALLVSGQTLALPEDQSKPIEILSDAVTFNEKEGKSIYTGNVIYRQGTIELKADKVIMYNGDNGIQRLTATGLPATYKEVPKPNEAPFKATANTIQYDAKKDHITLIKNARIEQRDESFSAPKISYDLTNRTISSRGGRTRIVINPENHKGLNRTTKQPS